jgi:hypothetical protein
MPRLTILLLSVMLGAGSAVLVSCGGDDGPDGAGIPTTDAEGMLGELERARAAFAQGDCAEVEESAEQIVANAENLANSDPPLDPEIQEGLTQGAQHLAELASTSSECQEQTTTTDDNDETTTEPTTTTPTTTTEETTTTTTTEEPPPSDGGQGGGQGGGPPVQPPGDTPGGAQPPGGSGTGGVGDGG